MRESDFRDLDLNIGRARIGLSLVTLLSIYIDPTTGGLFGIAPEMLVVLALHFAYSIGLYLILRRRSGLGKLLFFSTGMDVIFATALAFSTEGPTSPSYAFFAFAIIATGCRFGLRTTIVVTVCSVVVYTLTILSVRGVEKNLYLMRPAYLAITGYLIAFLGQQRAKFEARIRELESAAERGRIARSLHDGYVQELSSFNLRLGACQELLLKGRRAEALVQLQELRQSVTREYDEVRAYLRSLANLDQVVRNSALGNFDTQFEVEMAFSARGLIVEQIFQVILEGIRNAWRHGQAQSGKVGVAQTAGIIRIIIDDDGIGFRNSKSVPWSIASRVGEFGGHATVAESSHEVGAHLRIEMPIR